MNAWDIDPNLYVSLRKLLRDWLSKRKLLKTQANPGPDVGCRA